MFALCFNGSEGKSVEVLFNVLSIHIVHVKTEAEVEVTSPSNPLSDITCVLTCILPECHTLDLSSPDILGHSYHCSCNLSRKFFSPQENKYGCSTTLYVTKLTINNKRKPLCHSGGWGSDGSDVKIPD